MDANGNPVMRVAAAPTAKAESILTAARRTFLAGGFGAASMDAIAREAGASKATVYAYFASKEQLFGAIVADMSERYFRNFSASELDTADIGASLTTLARQFLDLLLAPDTIALNRILIGEVTRFPALGEVFWEAGPARTRAQIEAFLRRAADAGSLRIDDPREAAEQFASLVRGEIHLRHLMRREATPGPEAIAAAAGRAVDTFLRAFGTARSWVGRS
jgi:TetR/AcrR family transcriptional repressor of mexJK operon